MPDPHDDSTEQREGARRAADRRKDELLAAVRGRELEFRTLLENLHSGVALIDADGHFTLVNERFLEMFGFEREADILNVNSRDWSAWQVVDERGALLDVDDHPVRKAALTRRPVRNRLVGVRLPGSPDLSWMLVTAAPLFREDGTLEHVICTYYDVTESKRAEESLRGSEERYRSVVENMSEGLMVFDPGANLVYQNPASLRIHGFEPGQHEQIENPLLRTLWKAWDEQGRAITPEEWPVARVFRGERVRDQVLHVLGVETGEEFDASYNGAPIYDANGRLVLGFITIRDITEERRVQRALRESEARHRELADALREADRRKNDFLAVLSHELRNPLAPIRNSLYILRRATPGGEHARHAQEIMERQVAQLTRLVDDLLDLNRIERGKVRLHREEVALNDIVRRVGEDLRGLFERGAIRLEIDVPPGPVRVHGDPARIAQLVGNLLHNSVKFTPRGGWTRLSLAAHGGSARIEVRDDGIGIPSNLLPRLFESFVQSEGTIERAQGGLGLGLALVKGLAELHGGTVSAWSEGPGRGAIFTVELPVVGAEDRAPEAARPAPGRCGSRVLVIEDNADAATSLGEVLELNGHVVEIATTGREGLAKAASFAPDVVLCDVGLPEMDGYEVARALRADPRFRSVRLVALSGYALPDDVERSEEAGFDHHLAKPPGVEELEALLCAGPRLPAGG